MNICPKCRIWRLADGDIVCSWCRHRLVGVEAKLVRNRFLSSEIAPPVKLVLSSKSQPSQITVQSLDIDPAAKPWITIEGRKTPFVLEGDSTEEFTVRVDSASLPPESYNTALIAIRTNVGVEKLVIEVVPPPKILVSGYSGNEQRKSCIFDVILDDRNLERNLVRIAAIQGIVEIERIVIAEDLVSVRLPGDIHFPVVLDSRKSAYLDVFIDVHESILAQKGVPADYGAVLKVELSDFTHEERLMFKCWSPPALWIPEEETFQIEAWPGQQREFVLTLQNSAPGRPETGLGCAPLLVNKIEIQEPGGKPCEWLQPSMDLMEPFTVPGGKSRPIKFTFETDAAGKSEGKKIGIGRYSFIVALTTNLQNVSYRTTRFELIVLPMREFEGILAVDFGSSNTCCALFADSDAAYKLVEIDSPLYNTNPKTAPTVIQYLGPGENGQAKARIGAEINTLELSARVIRSTARSLKRRLGTPEPWQLSFYNLPEEVVNYPAMKVVGDYLLRVRAAVEKDNPGLQFRRLIITHPSRFTLRQITELKEAVQYAFVEECDIRLLPEPVAAALELVLKPEMVGLERYTLGVFDFGGGTTDLSLLEVINERSNGFTEVRARQINATGRWFGGEDLTRFVYERSMARCHEIAAKDYQGQVLNFDPKTAPDGNQRLVAVENAGRLMQWAEYCKLLLFKHGNDWAAMEADFPPNSRLFPVLHLTLRGDSGAHPRDFRPNQIAPKREELDNFVRSGLESLAGDLAALVSISNAGKLDYLCLSGKSSAIPLVREVLLQQFPNVEIRLAAEPKECVVQGACLSYQASFGASVFLAYEDSGFVQTTSRIGIADLLTGRFCEVVGLGVPVGKDGTKGYYEKFPLRRDGRIRLLENTSLNDALAGNKDITPIATFKVDPSFPGLPGNKAISARLEVSLSPNLTPTLTAYIGAVPVPLILEQNQRRQGVGK